MTELALATICALEAVDLWDELEDLRRRVIARSPELLFETRAIGAGVWEWSFRPMVELLLRHIRDVACAAARSREDRSREIEWTLTTAGF